MAKKSYNPFKMWGSYVGAYILPFFVTMIDIRNRSFLDRLIDSLTWFINIDIWVVMSNLRISILLIVGGFILGYGIHALIRRLRK